jgi:hypothetical protein
MTVRKWITLSLCCAGALILVTFNMFGAGERGTAIALQVTGRFSFLLFFGAYAGESLKRLLGSEPGSVLPSTRTFGLAFAAAHLAHLGLVGWICYIGSIPSPETFLLFGIATAATYLLALNSFFNLGSIIGVRTWATIRIFGLHYIAFVFILDFITKVPSASAKYILGYIPFAVLSVTAPILRLWPQATGAWVTHWRFVMSTLRGKSQVVANTRHAIDDEIDKPRQIAEHRRNQSEIRPVSKAMAVNSHIMMGPSQDRELPVQSELIQRL